MKKFILPLLLFFFLPVAATFAASSAPGNPVIDPCTTGENYRLCLAPGSIPKNIPPNYTSIVDDSVPYVTIQFTNLPTPINNSHPYIYCLKTDVSDCDDKWKDLPANKTLNVSGAGEGALKISTDTSGHDYFHSGNTYVVHIAVPDEDDCDGGCTKIKNSSILPDVAFYVKHFYPNLNVIPQGQNLRVILDGRNNKGGAAEGDSNLYNDYYVIIKSQDTDYVYSSPSSCIYVGPGGSGERTITLPTTSGGANKIPGDYILRIVDGAGGNSQSGDQASCHEGDFTYYDWPFTIDANNNIVIPRGPGLPIADPFQKEGNTTTQVTPPIPPCPTTAQNKLGYCTTVSTGLGIIHTEPKQFVADLFRIILSIGGIITIVFFIQAGYKLMNSSGNKEKVGQAREQITAAILGLIFIILSVAIFEFIGIDILHIPGLTR